MPTNKIRGENAKIVATLGPGSRSRREIRALAEAGVDVFRLNFSHGEHEAHREALEAVRAAEAALGQPLATLGDLQGPKVRVGTFPGGAMRLGFRGEYDLIAADSTDREDAIPVPHAEIVAVLEVGDTILVDDGKLILTVTRAGDAPRVRAEVPGKLGDKKGFTVRGKALPVQALTDKDRRDLAFALEIGVDIVALSFVQTVEDILEAKAIIAGRAPLVAKLEKPAAIANLIEIVEAADAVMVARGDLGVEFAPEDVPVIQRRIVRAARAAGRPVIVATQMLESMIENSAPTRAEASDVATAIYQGADAVMLSAETAVGRRLRWPSCPELSGRQRRQTTIIVRLPNLMVMERVRTQSTSLRERRWTWRHRKVRRPWPCALGRSSVLRVSRGSAARCRSCMGRLMTSGCVRHACSGACIPST